MTAARITLWPKAPRAAITNKFLMHVNTYTAYPYIVYDIYIFINFIKIAAF